MDALIGHVSANMAGYLVAALATGLVALGLVCTMGWRLRRLTRPLSRIVDSAADPGEILPSVLNLIEGNENALTDLRTRFVQYVEESRRCIRHVGLVRYNAFEDIAGQQSFSMCLLDEDRNGLLVTYLTGKYSTRSYAIPIAAGDAPRKLSDEERDALEKAMERATPVRVETPEPPYEAAPVGS